MQLIIDQIDAFTNEVFKGNYAAVIDVDSWLSDELMLKIAAENNVSETAFTVKQAEGKYVIRWFSPLTEIDFCGHATLAAALVLCEKTGLQEICFVADAVGELVVRKNTDQSFSMRFPKQAPEPLTDVPSQLLTGLSIQPVTVLKNRQAYFAIYECEQDVRDLKSNSEQLKSLFPLDVVATAKGQKTDFVSRYFWPANGGDEDFVTGSIHTGLAPYWAEQLGKKVLTAYQASSRGGELLCEVTEDSVTITGNAVRYMQGTIFLSI